VAHAALRKRRAGRGTQKGTPFVNAAGTSDHCVVPEKAPNQGETSGGAGGKAVDQGERNEGIHGPGAGPGNRVNRTSRRAGSRTKRQGTKVHHAAPRTRATAAGQLLSAEETSRARSGSGDLERVGTRGGGTDHRPPRPASSGSVPGAAITTSLHAETRRSTKAAGNRGYGRQNRAASCGNGSPSDL
jgi:hypothetical protein